MIRTNRSKIVSWFYCPRYRYLKYHALGKGLQRVGTGIPTIGGTMIHDTLRDISRGLPMEQAISIQRAAYDLELDKKASGHPHFDTIRKEQSYMLEALVRAFHRVRQPQIDRDFELVTAERAMLWKLSDDIEMDFRFDRVERHRSTGVLYLRDFKTVGYAGMEWVRKWEKDPQIFAYLKAAQELLGEDIGGLFIEGLVRGKRKRETGKSPLFPGLQVQQSPLCYAYKMGTNGSVKWSPRYVQGWKKVPLWEEMTPQEWIEEKLSEEQVSELFLAPVPEINPNPQRLERWRVQSDALERDIQSRADRVQGKIIPLLDVTFPQNTDACYKYGEDYPCEMEPICFNGEVESDPIGSGLYEERQSHHADDED